VGHAAEQKIGWFWLNKSSLALGFTPVGRALLFLAGFAGRTGIFLIFMGFVGGFF
jgi:hypothetical protein